VVAVAGGLHKAEAILGALHGGFLNVLMTNELVALRLLELEEARRPGRAGPGRVSLLAGLAEQAP
jgi:Putative sugar-binding domain